MKKENYEKLEMDVMDFGMNEIYMDESAVNDDYASESDEGIWTGYY